MTNKQLYWTGWLVLVLVLLAGLGFKPAGTGELTWYQDGELTANGERFVPTGYTCAVRDRKELNKWIRFSYNHSVVYCYANDMMPQSSKANYDLTPAAFARLAPLKAGRIKGVEVRVVE